MKYCSKCGNELHDDAVICPKCGCPVEAKQSSNKTSNSKIRTALLLNIFAFVIALFSIVNYCYEVSKSDNNNDSTYILLFGLLALITLSFILCIIINAFARKGEIKSFLAWSYVVSVVITTIFYALLAPVLFFAAICGMGILIPIPPILQIIAAVKLIQATKE